MTQLTKLLEEHARCVKAFRQNPTPPLGSALKRIEAAIKYQRRVLKLKEKP